MIYENNLAKSYLQTLKRYSPLSEKELNDQIHKAHAGDKKAFDNVIQTNLRFVITVAATFRNTELSFDERVAEGNMGLMRAVEKFDPDRGYKFTTYAVWWIRQAIQKAIWRNKQPFHRPLNQFEDWDLIRRKTGQMTQQSGLAPSIIDVQEALGMTPLRLEGALSTQRATTRLDAPSIENGPSVSESLPDHQPDPLDLLENKDSSNSIHTALATLTPRDAEVIALTFGLEGEPLSFSKVGKRLGISKERVRQLRNRALANLRNQLQRFGPQEDASADNTITLSRSQNQNNALTDKICA